MTRLHLDASARRAWFAVLLHWPLASACSSPEPASSQITVRVDADPAVAQQLSELRVAVYGADESVDPVARESHAFDVRQQAPESGEVRLPFSFGVRGVAERVLFVFEGHATRGALGDPLVEHKAYAEFSTGKTLLLEVHLSAGCLQLAEPCVGSEQTCNAQPRAAQGSGVCGPPAAPALATSEPGTELPVLIVPSASSDDASHADPGDVPEAGAPEDANTDAEDQTPDAPDASLQTHELAACAQPRQCFDSTYPCVTDGESYTCSGLLAEWVVAGDMLGSADAPRFDLEDPEVAVDRVTGLSWQRRLREVYPGCSGGPSSPGVGCTFEEARAYCAGLTLAGQSARLPSLIELESLLDLAQDAGYLALDPEAFGTPPVPNLYWSRTPLPSADLGLEPLAVLVDFEERLAQPAPVTTVLGVRCVAGGKLPAGTPRDRYRVDSLAGTATDTRTGLTWKREPVKVTADWQRAQSACETAGPGFRQATYLELMTLVDATAQGLLLPPELRSGALTNITWASTLSTSGTAYYVSFSVAVTGDAVLHQRMREQLSDPDAGFGYEVRCVRAEP